jgi:hypothetical protein
MNKLVIDWCPAYLYVLFSFTLVQGMRTSVSHDIHVSTYDSLGTGFNIWSCVPYRGLYFYTKDRIKPKHRCTSRP